MAAVRVRVYATRGRARLAGGGKRPGDSTSSREVRRMEARRLLVIGLGAMLLVTVPPSIRAGGGVASARVHETFREPRVWRSKDGVLRRTLQMRRAATRLGRRRILTLTYNGAIPGPTWRGETTGGQSTPPGQRRITHTDRQRVVE